LLHLVLVGERRELAVLLLTTVLLDVLLLESLLDGESTEGVSSSNVGGSVGGVGSGGTDDGGLSESSVDGSSAEGGGSQNGGLRSQVGGLVLVVNLVGVLDGLLGVALVAVEGLLAVSPGDEALIVSGAADHGLSDGHEGWGHRGAISADGGTGNDGSSVGGGVGSGGTDEGGLNGESSVESSIDGLSSEARDGVGLNVTNLGSLVLGGSISADLLLLNGSSKCGGKSELGVRRVTGLRVESHF